MLWRPACGRGTNRPVQWPPVCRTVGVTLAGRLTVRRDDGGQALVEIALAIPLVFLVLLGGADFARGINIDIALGRAARSAADHAALSDAPALLASTAALRGGSADTTG